MGVTLFCCYVAGAMALPLFINTYFFLVVNVYPPFTRKPIALLSFGQDARSHLGLFQGTVRLDLSCFEIDFWSSFSKDEPLILIKVGFMNMFLKYIVLPSSSILCTYVYQVLSTFYGDFGKNITNGSIIF